MINDIPFAQLKKDSYDEDSRKLIDGWENRAIELVAQESFRNHPTTQKLAEEARQSIKAIENILSNDETVTEVERKALFKEKKVHQIYLNLFTYDPSGELNQIADNVIEELN